MKGGRACVMAATKEAKKLLFATHKALHAHAFMLLCNAG
jgi:hypothetical protein